ncbi:hypothetical protein [Streptomyces sp. IBSNAI001]|uniref:hypothetical protein n=1 Tax=Streptomyces sp. IBSNAI001 TaxID=3457499 RepID=UPI003FD3E34C
MARERGQHSPVLGRGGELQLLRQVEHHRPVPAELPVQQHLPEVAVMRGDLLDLLVLPREPAEALHRLGDRPQAAGLHQLGLGQGEHGRGDLPAQAPGDLFHRRCLVQPFQGLHGLAGHRRGLRKRLLGGAAVVEVLEHGAVVPDQGLDDLPLGEPDLLQLLLGLLDLHGDPLAKHRRQIVPYPHSCLVGEAGQQRDPLDGCVVPQFGGVRRVRFPGAGDAADERFGGVLAALVKCRYLRSAMFGFVSLQAAPLVGRAGARAGQPEADPSRSDSDHIA